MTLQSIILWWRRLCRRERASRRLHAAVTRRQRTLDKCERYQTALRNRCRRGINATQKDS